MTKQEISEYLISKNVRPSIYRVNILESMMTKKNHPTADMIYNEISKEIPTMSKTTVYNTLDLFVKSGVAQLITIDDYEKRYDADITTHGHFKCNECGMIYDFFIDLPSLENNILKNFEITEKHIYFSGKCEKCKNKKGER